MKLFPCLLLALAAAPAAQAQTRPKPATPPAPAAAAQMKPGSYECWANGSARMGMNFTVTGPGAYKNDSGPGKYTIGAGGRLTLTGPMLESLPTGFYALYEVRKGTPTVSFQGRSGEAAFCEWAGK